MSVPYPIINYVLPWTQAVAGLNQLIYSTDWTADVAADVVVYSRAPNVPTDDALQIVNPNNYTVSFIGDENIVQVTFVNNPPTQTPPPQYNIVTITRMTAVDRLNLYTNTNFTPSMLNSDFGTITLIEQELELFNQQITPRYNISETVRTQDPVTGLGYDQILPILEANQVWVKNSSNTQIVAVDFSSEPAPPIDGAYVIYSPDVSLPEAFNLGSLTSGILAQNVNEVTQTSMPYVLAIPLEIDYGGTGVIETPTTPVASQFAAWDTNKNIYANNALLGYATTVTAAGNTVLTAGSAYQQYFTGTTTQTVTMPDVTAGSVLGQSWLIVNNSSGAVQVNSDAGDSIIAMPAATDSIITCISLSDNTASGWNYESTSGSAGVGSITGTTNQIIASSPTGDVTLSLPQDIDINCAFQADSIQLNSGEIYDSNGNLSLNIEATASAVNYIDCIDAATTTYPAFAAAGSDTNIGIKLNSKGNAPCLVQGSKNGSTNPAGYVGQIIQSNVPHASPVSISSGTPSNLTSIALTAGNWMITGNVFSTFNTTGNAILSGISSTSNTFPDQSYIAQVYNTTNYLNIYNGVTAPTLIVSITSNTTYYLVVQLNSATGNASAACGNLQAIRI